MAFSRIPVSVPVILCVLQTHRWPFLQELYIYPQAGIPGKSDHCRGFAAFFPAPARHKNQNIESKEGILKQVVCALILEKGKLLIVRHGPGGYHPLKWEFPGGKINPGETQEDALCREIREELEATVEVLEPLAPVVHAYDSRIIRLIPFLCRLISPGLQLNEHIESKWIDPREILDYDILPADRQMLAEEHNFERLMESSGKQKQQP